MRTTATTTTATSKKRGARNRATSTAPNEAALYVLTDCSLMQYVATFASGIPYFVYQVKQQLVCASKKTDPTSPPPQDIELWQTAIRTSDRQTLEALAVLSKTESLGPSLSRVLESILGYALVHSRDMALLEWLLTDGVFSDDICLATIEDDEAIGEQGDVALVEWLWAHDYKFDSSVAIGAARGGHLALIQRLHENEAHELGSESRVTIEAVKHGHLNIVRYIHEHRRNAISLTGSAWYYMLDTAATKGNLAMVQYIHEHGVGRGTQAAIVNAAVGGHLDIVKYLHEHRLAHFGGAALDSAVANGHLEIVQYLHEHELTTKRSQLIDKAIEHKHFEIAQFLFDACSQRCSGKAMAEAVKRGDVELLETMSAYCDDGALQQAMLTAADLGSVKLLRFLFAKVNESSCHLPREDLVNNAARKGNLALLQFFHEHAHFRFSAATMHYAAVAGHLHVVKFLHENVRNIDCKVKTLFECDHRELVRVLAYLCTHRPMSNPAKAVARAKREGRLVLAAKLEHSAHAATTYVYS